MASRTAQELRERVDAAWGNLSRQLQGMEPHMERAGTGGSRPAEVSDFSAGAFLRLLPKEG